MFLMVQQLVGLKVLDEQGISGSELHSTQLQTVQSCETAKLTVKIAVQLM